MVQVLRELPAPRQDDCEWQSRAACRGVDTETFYRADFERGARQARREERAKQICRTCPVMEQCLQWALEAREPYGIWGGMSPDEREALLPRRHGAA